jgi:hypothetical protein
VGEVRKNAPRYVRFSKTVPRTSRRTAVVRIQNVVYCACERRTVWRGQPGLVSAPATRRSSGAGPVAPASRARAGVSQVSARSVRRTEWSPPPVAELTDCDAPPHLLIASVAATRGRLSSPIQLSVTSARVCKGGHLAAGHEPGPDHC